MNRTSPGSAVRTEAPASGTTPTPITLPAKGEVGAWVEHLPMAHTGELSRTLHGALTQLRDEAMDSTLRLETLEALCSPMAACQHNLARHYHNRPLPVPGRGMRVFHLATTLHYNLAQGYMRVLDDANQQRWLLVSDRSRQLALCAQRAWHYMGRVLADYRHFNLPAPAGLWRRMYLVLRKAQSLNIAQLKPGKGHQHTAEDEFIAQLLLTQFPDQQLSKETLEALRGQCQAWARRLKLRQGTAPTGGNALHLLADSDLPPSPLALTKSSDIPLFLDLSPLLKQLARNRCDEIEALARRCLRNDSPREERLRSEGERLLIYGLNAIHQELLQQSDEATREHLSLEPNTQEQNQVVLQEAWLSHAKNWVPVYGRAPRHWSKRFYNQEETQQARLENNSPGGISLSLDAPKKSLMHNGGLVAVGQCVESLRLGLVRWIRPNDKELRMGIEWLADKLHPALLRIGDDDEAIRRPALLAFDGGHGLVISAHLPGITDKPLWLEVEGKRFTIDTGRIHSSTPHVIIFHSPLADETLEGIEEDAEVTLDSDHRRLRA